MQCDKLQNDPSRYEIRPASGWLSLPRFLAPAPSAPSPRDIWNARHDGGGSRFLAQRLLHEFGLGCNYVAPANLFSSGKAALVDVLLRARQHRRDVTGEDEPTAWLVCGAYTCPDVAAAAVRAGFRLALCDVDPQTLAIRWASLPIEIGQITAVVHSNLYGIPEPLAPAALFTVPPWNPVVIDDASQSALAATAGGLVGARGADASIFSFGRGKALSGIGGGANLFSQRLSTVSGATLRKAAFRDEAVDGVRGVLLWLLARPELYGIPAQIPALGIGETHYDGDFSIAEPSRMQTAYAFSRMCAIDASRRTAEFARTAWLEVFRDTSHFPIESSADGAEIRGSRFAVLCESGAARSRLTARLRRFGATVSYPRTLDEYPELSGHWKRETLGGATLVRDQILTLPCSDVVTDNDRAKVRSAVEE